MVGHELDGEGALERGRSRRASCSTRASSSGSTSPPRPCSSRSGCRGRPVSRSTASWACRSWRPARGSRRRFATATWCGSRARSSRSREKTFRVEHEVSRRRHGAARAASRCAPGWRRPRRPAAGSRARPIPARIVGREAQGSVTTMGMLAGVFLSVHTPRYCTLEAAFEGKLASEVFRPVRDGMVAQGARTWRGPARRDRDQLLPPRSPRFPPWWTARRGIRACSPRRRRPRSSTASPTTIRATTTWRRASSRAAGRRASSPCWPTTSTIRSTTAP